MLGAVGKASQINRIWHNGDAVDWKVVCFEIQSVGFQYGGGFFSNYVRGHLANLTLTYKYAKIFFLVLRRTANDMHLISASHVRCFNSLSLYPWLWCRHSSSSEWAGRPAGWTECYVTERSQVWPSWHPVFLNSCVFWDCALEQSNPKFSEVILH